MKLEKLRKRQDFLAANGGRRWSAPGFVLLARERRANAGKTRGPDDASRENGGRENGAQANDGHDAADVGAPRVGFTVTKRIGTSVTWARPVWASP